MKRLSALLISLCLLLAACGGADPAADAAKSASLRDAFLAKAEDVLVDEHTVTFTDASGASVTIEKNPSSVVCMHTSLTTLWYEAGSEVIGCIGSESAVALYTEYIGRDITADAGMTVVAKSAAAKNWNVESILALRPSLIICSTAMNGYDTLRGPAAAAGIPLVAAEYDDFADYLKWFKVFCHLSGNDALWDSVAMRTLDEVVGVLNACPTENTPRVFSMFASAGRLQANTSATVVGGMITAMNGVNIADSAENAGGAQRLEINLETVYAADPDVILVQCHADLDASAAAALVQEQYGDNPVWQALTAVQEGRVYYLEKNLFHNKPNRRFAEAYRVLAEILYPTFFADA